MLSCVGSAAAVVGRVTANAVLQSVRAAVRIMTPCAGRNTLRGIRNNLVARVSIEGSVANAPGRWVSGTLRSAASPLALELVRSPRSLDRTLRFELPQVGPHAVTGDRVELGGDIGVDLR